MKDMNLIETNLLPRGPEGFRDEVSTIENVCYRLSFRTCLPSKYLIGGCGLRLIENPDYSVVFLYAPIKSEHDRIYDLFLPRS
jgi:hypothetical protein